MARKMQMISVLTILVAMMMATVGVAAANPVEDYRTSMRGFLPVIEDWTTELQQATHEAAIKPLPERIAAVEELATRGFYILDDLRGTAELTPQSLMATHWQLADAVGTMAVAAERVSENQAAAAELVDGQIEFARPALNQIQNFVNHFGARRPGDIPAQPGAGR